MVFNVDANNVLTQFVPADLEQTVNPTGQQGSGLLGASQCEHVHDELAQISEWRRGKSLREEIG